MIPVEPITAAPLCYSFHNKRTMTPLQNLPCEYVPSIVDQQVRGPVRAAPPVGHWDAAAIRDNDVLRLGVYFAGSRQRVVYRGRTLADRRQGGGILTTVPSGSERPLAELAKLAYVLSEDAAQHMPGLGEEEGGARRVTAHVVLSAILSVRLFRGDRTGHRDHHRYDHG